MSFFSHLGKSSSSYVYQLQVHEVAPLACVEALQVIVTRGKKTHGTRVALSDGARCKFDEVLQFVSTIYAKKGKAGRPDERDKKTVTITVQTDAARTPRLSLVPGTKQRLAVHLSTEVDLATFASDECLGREITRSFPLEGTGGSAIAPPLLKITFKVAPVAKGMEAAAKGGHRANQHSMSLSAASPMHPTNNTLDSFSQRAQDELSPEISARQLKASPSSPTPQADLASRKLLALSSGGRGFSKRNLYGEMEEQDGDANPSEQSQRAVDNQSYAIDEEHVATPPRKASPEARLPTSTPPPIDEDDEDADLPALPMRSPTSTTTRRSETQLFSQIMVDAIHQPASASAAAMTSPPSLARKPSLRGLAPSPEAVSRRVALASSPNSTLVMPPQDSLRVSTTSADDDADARSAADTAGGGGYFFQSYAADSDDESPEFAPQLPPEDVDADGDDHVGRDSASFADRHGGLTIDDILTPGPGGGDLEPVSSGPSGGRPKRHGRTISLFSNPETGAAATEQILRPQTTQARGSAIGKFFAAASLVRKISTTRNAAAKQPDSQPASAASPRTPMMQQASIFAATSSQPGTLTRLHSTSEADSASTASRSSKQATLDEMLEGGGSGGLLVADHPGGSGSRLHSRQDSRSRQHSRSSSPSRSAGGTPAQASVAAHMHGQTLSLAAIASPSPRNSSKQMFPVSSPAKHSLAHRMNSSPGNSLGSLGQDDAAKLALGLGLPPTGAPQLDANGAEVGSYAAWKAQSKANKMRASSRGSNGSNSSGGSAHDSLQRNESAPAPTKSLPRPVVSSGGSRSRPASSLTRETSTSLTVAANADGPLSISVTTPGGISSSAKGTGGSVGLADITTREQQFKERMLGGVQLLCQQLRIPDLSDQADDSLPVLVAPDVNATSPLPSSAAAPSTPLKSLWSSLKSGLSPTQPPAPATNSPPVSPSVATVGAASPIKPSPSPAAASFEASFHLGTPTWSVVALRCLAEWDAFAVSSVVDEKGDIVRVASRTWMLSMLLTHLNSTCTFLCARSAAGQKQNAMSFFIAHLVALIQLVEGYARSSQAPPPFPVLSTLVDPSAPATYPVASTDEALQLPTFPAAFASHRGLATVSHLPQESSARICEVARARLRQSRTHVVPSSPSAPQVSFPYSLELGVSTYTWFVGHLRAQLQQAFQCLVEVVLTEVEMVDPTAILTSTNTMDSDEVGFEADLEQLLRTYTKIVDDLTRNHVALPLRLHFVRCLAFNLNATLFNTILSSVHSMTMTTGMRLKIVHTSMQDWARSQGKNGGQDASPANGAVDESAELERICVSELAECQQLALLLLMSKSSLTLDLLSALCPSLTPISLYHLLLNYLPRNSASPAADADVEQDELADDHILEELTEYQTHFLSNRTPAAATPSHPILFPKWSIHPQPQVADQDTDDDEATPSTSRTPHTAGAVQSPFLDSFRPLGLPRLSAAQSSGVNGAALLKLSTVPAPEPLLDSKTFRFLDSPDGLVLPVSRG